MTTTMLRWRSFAAVGTLVCMVDLSCGTAISQRLLLKDYTTQDGLPDSRVAPIMQDRDGYVWFGTQAGLTRYDGREFTNVTQAQDIPGIFGRYIIQDSSGAIWFGYTGIAHGGLLRLWHGTVTDYAHSGQFESDQIVCLAEDRYHDIWAGTDSGLYRIHFTDPGRSSFIVEEPTHRAITALFVDRAGTLWISAIDEKEHGWRGSFRPFERVVNQWTADGFRSKNVGANIIARSYAVYQRDSGEIWAGGQQGAAVITTDTIRYFSAADGLPERGVWSFCEDRNGNFWIGTTRGLYLLRQTNRSYQFEKQSSFGDAVVYDICRDREGNVWFASAPGVRKLLASNLVMTFPGDDKLATAGFGPIAEAGDGGIYFGSRNSGLYYLKGNRLISGRSVPPFTSFTYTTILAESRTKTWFGLRAGGVYLKDGPNVIQDRFSDALPSPNVNVISKTAGGNILIGTAAGLAMVDTLGTVHQLRNSELDSLTIFDIKTTQSTASSANPENIWLATMHGVRLVHLNNDSLQTVQRVPTLAQLDNFIVYELLTDTDGTLWCGTNGLGLARYNGSSLVSFTTTDGLVGNRVFALAKDSTGTIWVGTSSGLSQFDGESFRNFTHDQGFGEIGLHGLTVDRDSNLWVSSFPGITKIRPRPFYKSNLPPPIQITDVEVDTLHVMESQHYDVPPDHAVLTFHYAGLSFSDEQQVRYKYKLEGFDRNWSSPVLTREVRYTHLPSGVYRFLVLARSRDRVWSAQPARFSFRVLPPFWARWWFIVASFSALFGLVYSAYRYRLNKLLELERTRSRIAMDLHDDIGSSLTRISVLSEVARYQEGAQHDEATETIAKIGDTARELIDALGDIVWSVDPKHDDLQGVIRRIVQFGQETCEGRSIQFETDLVGEYSRTKLSLDQRRDVFLIFKEAVNNIVKHSGASSVKFRSVRDGSGVVLILSDDGTGFNEGSDQAGNGLHSMRQRGNRVGRLTILSQKAKGTTVSLNLKTV